MSLVVRVDEKPDATVVRLGGAVDPDVLELVADGLAAVSGVGRIVVLDIDELTILDPAALERLVNRLDAADPGHPGRVRLACSRATARRLLARRLKDNPLVVYASVEAALRVDGVGGPVEAVVTRADDVSAAT